jgi:flagellar basal body-associated protein FliL
MFKRLFILSGIIAFILAALTMWFWYLPKQQQQQVEQEIPADSTQTEMLVE